MATWRTHAGRDRHNGGFRNFGHPRYVQAFGHEEVIAVELIEDPDGPYYGWMGFEQRIDGKVWHEADTTPQLIQQHDGMFSMQFAYGVEAEVKAGKGRVVRLRAVEITEI